jgi:hypothetical protein
MDHKSVVNPIIQPGARSSYFESRPGRRHESSRELTHPGRYSWCQGGRQVGDTRARGRARCARWFPRELVLIMRDDPGRCGLDRPSIRQPTTEGQRPQTQYFLVLLIVRQIRYRRFRIAWNTPSCAGYQSHRFPRDPLQSIFSLP